MAMTRKHYREAAEIIKGAQQAPGDLPSTARYAAYITALSIASGLADMFERDNAAFDRQKFMEACGL